MDIWTKPKLVRVYKIVHTCNVDELEDMYIGSTTMTLSRRMSCHRAKSRAGNTSKLYVWMRDIGVENCAIVCITTHACNSFEEQRMKEQEVKTRLNPNLNSCDAYISRGERIRRDRDASRLYRAAHIDEKRAADRAYYGENRERLCEYQKEYRAENSEKIADYMKEYRAKMGEDLLQKKRDYYYANHDKIRAEQNKKYEENKDELNKRNMELYYKNHQQRLKKDEERRRAKGVKPRVVYTDEERKAARKMQKENYLAKNPGKKHEWKKAWDAKNADRVKEYRKRRYQLQKLSRETTSTNLDGPSSSDRTASLSASMG